MLINECRLSSSKLNKQEKLHQFNKNQTKPKNEKKKQKQIIISMELRI